MFKKIAAVVVAAGVLLATGGAASSCGSSNVGASQSASDKTMEIVYEVSGKGSASITYSSDGTTEQIDKAPLPWKKSINVDKGFAMLSIVAQSKGGGSVTCKISNGEGKVLKTATSTGQYAVVTCADSVTGY